MAKQGGLGARLLVGGYDISGDIQALDKVSGGPGLLDVTDITQSGHARIGGQRDGSMAATVFMDAANAHPVLSALPRTDTLMMFLLPTLAVGGAAASLNARQINYDPTRAANGDLTIKTEGQGDRFGLEWGRTLTPGVYTPANLLTGQNAGFEGGTGNWAATQRCTIADSSAQAHTGADSLAITSTGAGSMTTSSCGSGVITTQGFAVTPGQLYSLQFWARAAAAVEAVTAQFQWYTSGGALISTSSGTPVNDTSTGWTLVTAMGQVAPATAAFGRVQAFFGNSALNEVHYIDDVLVLADPGSLNNGQAYGFGAQLYLELTAFTGTDVTVSVQHAPDNATWTPLGSFSQVTAAPTFQRLQLSGYFTCPAASPAVFTTTNTAVTLAANQPVQLAAPPAGGTNLPGGFSAATTYYAISPSGGTFQLAATPSGSPINATSAGAGVAAALVQQYLQATLSTAGGFTAVSYAVAASVNQTLVVF